MKILGIESTCDETGVSIVEDGRKILSNVVASSVNLHRKYGGVVPEVAAREQIRVIIPVIEEALDRAFESIRKKNSRKFAYPIDAIAVAYGPGLIGSLLIGVETSKALALAWNKPLIAVNHLIGHIYANWLDTNVNRLSLIANGDNRNQDERETVRDLPKFPLIALIVSGGHTDLILMKNHEKYEWLGGTLDDAAGEAFDKVARVLGLGYPGGPAIEREARQFTLRRCSGQAVHPSTLLRAISSQLTVKLPRPKINDNDFDFSFSGLKTAVANRIINHQLNIEEKAEIATEFQSAIVDVLISKTLKAAKKIKVKSIVVGGGVAANGFLRSQFVVHGNQIKVPVFFPDKKLAVDNGAMVAAAAFYNFKKIDPLTLSANPSLYF